MLTLTRRVGEVIQIGEDAAVVVLEIQGSQVKLGFQFPRETHIVRAELLPEASPPVRYCNETMVLVHERNRARVDAWRSGKFPPKAGGR